jgi:hypothetical protein
MTYRTDKNAYQNLFRFGLLNSFSPAPLLLQEKGTGVEVPGLTPCPSLKRAGKGDERQANLKRISTECQPNVKNVSNDGKMSYKEFYKQKSKTIRNDPKSYLNLHL